MNSEIHSGWSSSKVEIICSWIFLEFSIIIWTVILGSLILHFFLLVFIVNWLFFPSSCIIKEKRKAALNAEVLFLDEKGSTHCKWSVIWIKPVYLWVFWSLLSSEHKQHPQSNASDEQSALEIAFIALKFKIQVQRKNTVVFISVLVCWNHLLIAEKKWLSKNKLNQVSFKTFLKEILLF